MKTSTASGIDLANVEGALHVNLENDGTAGREVAVDL